MTPNKARIRRIRARYAVLGDPKLFRYRECSAPYLFAKMRAAGWTWDRRGLVWIKPPTAEGMAA